MKVSYEIEIDLNDFIDEQICEDLEERIDMVGCLWTEKYQKIIEPKKEEMRKKLEEILHFLKNPKDYVNP